jgi:hypothetical protein
MKQTLLGILLLFLLSCSNQSNQKVQVKGNSLTISNDTSYVWTKLLDSADWKKSYNFQMFAIKDSLWIFHHDGNWFSADGVNWTKSSLPNSIYNLAFLSYVYFKNAIYGLGHFEGNIDQFTFRNEIYRSTDFKQWTILSKSNNLPNRFFYRPFVFDNKIWIIGGEDKNTDYSDIWNSVDGITWVKQKHNLPFGKRNGSQIVFLNGKLFLLNNDVWSSADGLNWQKETDEIVKGEKVFGYAAVVYDNKIWLLGCNRNGQFKSQVFVSDNGKNWQGQEAPWTPRGGIAAAVYRGKIYMTGGKYGGFAKDGRTTEFIYSNDVWTLTKKE